MEDVSSSVSNIALVGYVREVCEEVELLLRVMKLRGAEKAPTKYRLCYGLTDNRRFFEIPVSVEAPGRNEDGVIRIEQAVAGFPLFWATSSITEGSLILGSYPYLNTKNIWDLALLVRDGSITLHSHESGVREKYTLVR